jgi:hypothetical protein
MKEYIPNLLAVGSEPLNLRTANKHFVASLAVLKMISSSNCGKIVNSETFGCFCSGWKHRVFHWCGEMK